MSVVALTIVGSVAIALIWFSSSANRQQSSAVGALVDGSTDADSATARHLIQALREVDEPSERMDLLKALSTREPESAYGFIEQAWIAERPDLVARIAKARVKAHPAHVEATEHLIRALLAQGKTERADKLLARATKSEPMFQLLRAERLIADEKFDEATPIVVGLCERAELEAKLGVFDGASPYWGDVHARAQRLRELMLRAVAGPDAVFRDMAATGNLAPRSGVNHMLAGQSAMARSRRIAESLELTAIQTGSGTIRDAEDALREGDLARAKRLFQAHVERDPSFFPGQLGLGSVLSMEEHRSLASVLRLPEATDDWSDIVPDWPVLTPLEQRVVEASGRPLARALPGLRAAGAQIFLLPIDVRPTDRPELAALEHEHASDGRALAGIGGMAAHSDTHTIAISRIEQLLDIGGNRVFAHELAHMAFWFLPEAEQQRFHDLFDTARQVEWAWTEYQRSNIDEFFAVSYEDWIGERWGVHQTPPDSSGWWGEVCAFFASLG